MSRKNITVIVPTLNEEDNVSICYEAVKRVFEKQIPQHDWTILFIDNHSTDGTRDMISGLCEEDERVQAIFNGKNFGYNRSTMHALIESKGDCAILLHADLQDPAESIPEMVEKWESGHKVVCGQKRSNEENRLIELLRKAYYHLLDHINEYGHIEQYNGFGLYDRSFLEVLSQIDDPLPYFRGMVAELAPNVAIVQYDHKKRDRGASKFSFLKLLDYSLMGITSTSKVAMRLASLIGSLLFVLCIAVAVITLIVKIIHWDTYPVGVAAIIIGIFFIGAIQLMFIGVMGEYITNMNIRIMKRPLVVEEKRINMDH